MNIGEKIRIVRLGKGLSQENFAEMLGISLVAYNKIERNETDMGFNRLEQIADKLGMKVHELTAVGEPGVIFQFNKVQQNGGNQGIGFSTAQIINFSNEFQDKMKEMESRLVELEKKTKG